MGPNLRLVDACAQAFLHEFGADCRERLPHVASTLGLEIVEQPAESYDGTLLRLAGGRLGTIVINSRIRSDGRKLFTLAHEIGHYILPNQQNLLEPCTADDIESWRHEQSRAAETEANRFAAEILMPRPDISDALRKPPSFDVIRSISATCGVSLTAAAYRLTELASPRVAVVWSCAGEALWYSSSNEFQRAIRRGPLDHRTFAYDCFYGDPPPDRFEEVPAAAWLYEVNLREAAAIREHSVALPSYEAALSLLWIPERVEIRTEFDDDTKDPSLDPAEFTLDRKHWPKR